MYIDDSVIPTDAHDGSDDNQGAEKDENAQEGGASGEELNILPSYLREEYDKTKSKVRNLVFNNCPVFLFATDLHFSSVDQGPSNRRKTMESLFNAINRFSTDVKCDVFVLGGDYMGLPRYGTGQTKEMGFHNIEDLFFWSKDMRSPRFFIMGNHEYNYEGTGKGFGMTEVEFDSVCTKKIIEDGFIHETKNSKLYYYDEVNTRMRYLFLNTWWPNYGGMKEELINLLKATPEGYSVIVFNHFSGASASNGGEITKAVSIVLDWIKETGVDFVAWIGGHNHADMSYVHNGMLVISCVPSIYSVLTDVGYDGIKYKRTFGNDGETAFSAFVIRKDIGKLFLVRYGFGNDRVFNYNTISGEVGLAK